MLTFLTAAVMMAADPKPVDLPPVAGADPAVTVVVSRAGGVWRCEHKGCVLTLPGDTGRGAVEKAAMALHASLSAPTMAATSPTITPAGLSSYGAGSCSGGNCGQQTQSWGQGTGFRGFGLFRGR